MSKGKSIIGAALAVALAFGATEGAKAAAIVTSAGDSFALSFGQTYQGTPLSATGTLTVNSLSSTTMEVAVSLSNTTTAAGENRITAFGFEINPGVVTGVTSLTSSWAAEPNANISGGYTSIDVCAFDTGQCNSANPGSEGIFKGITETVLLSLTGNFTNPFEITDVVLKFASIGALDGSTTVAGGTAPTVPPTAVPEPASLALFGLGLLGLGVARRSRRQASA